MAFSVDVLTDATAAIGRRRGLGKFRNLAVADLWVQDRLRARDFELINVPGSENVADLFTKYLGKPEHQTHTLALGLHAEDGRADSAARIGDHVLVCCLSQFSDPIHRLRR